MRDARRHGGDSNAGASENELDAKLAQCASQPCAFVVFLVDDWDSHEECGQANAQDGDKDYEASETRCKCEAWVSVTSAERASGASGRTRTADPFRLEGGNCGKAAHRQEHEEYLGGV